MPEAKRQTEKYTFAVGRRKGAIARVRLFKGRRQTLVNNKPISEYFPGEVARVFYEKPFKLADVLGKHYATVRVSGGGIAGQLEAVIHGLSRALSEFDRENFRPKLKKEGLLTRDARTRQRRMVGTGGKARRRKQSPKR